MEYKQVTQTSRPYEYGEGKEFLTREDALGEIDRIKRNLSTDLALKKLYHVSKIEVLEIPNAFQIVITTKIPILVEEKVDS